ncbi:MAG: FAD-binding oxidoreductase [Rhodobacteraceae bacterium]|jgi:D-amino-acid dehydrogenase|nr:FAD-binding oxidoreductase [Paracoccaceae bacterium]
MTASRTVVVIGAGIVGLTTAIALQDRGCDVTLIGEDVPGRGASVWNAGVLATSSITTMANPAIFRQLPAILAGRHPGVVLDWGILPRLLPWGSRFLLASRRAHVAPRARTLAALIARSAGLHADLLARAGRSADLVRNGWMFLLRDPGSVRAAGASLGFYRDNGVTCRLLTSDEVASAEPALARRYAGAVLFDDTAAVREPAWVMEAYLGLFLSAGGRCARKTAVRISRQDGAEVVHCSDGSSMAAAQVVVAAGARSRRLLAGIVDLPMLSERGYAVRLRVPPDKVLRRPVYDSAAGIVMSPRPDGIQISTGSHVTVPDRPTRRRQIDRAHRAACGILSVAASQDLAVEHGDRPTLPDGLPAIGRLPARPDIWLATGHQHIGFSTAPATAELLADLLTGRPAVLDPSPFRPERFL